MTSRGGPAWPPSRAQTRLRPRTSAMELYTHNSVAVLIFPAGAGYPRLTRALLAELRDLLESIEREGLFRGVVIAANSDSFATGAEIEEVRLVEGIAARQFAELGQSLFERIERFPVPVIAAIRGYCLGGGLDLALSCHGRVATYDASFGHPGTSLGLITGWSGTQRLPRLIGKAQALEMLVTAQRIPATQALTLGLVDELVDTQDLIDAAARQAERLTVRGGADDLPFC